MIRKLKSDIWQWQEAEAQKNLVKCSFCTFLFNSVINELKLLDSYDFMYKTFVYCVEDNSTEVKLGLSCTFL